MRIKVIGHTPDEDFFTATSKPWSMFFQALKQRHEIVTSKIGAPKFDCLVVNSHSPKALKLALKLGIPKSKILMIYWEPSVSYSKLHTKKIRNQYGKVYTPSKDWSNQLGGTYFNWPQVLIKDKYVNFKNWQARKNKTVMILANKFSAKRGQNYSLRRKTWKIKDRDGNFVVDLFGTCWNKGFYYDFRHFFGMLARTRFLDWDFYSWIYLGKKQKNYLGMSSNKKVTAEDYRINLVIENCSEYISEKLFEAHLSQNIVIYVGANLANEGINPGIAIEVPPRISAIKDAIIKIQSLHPKEQFNLMKKQQAIARKESKVRFNDNVLAGLAKTISKDLSKK